MDPAPWRETVTEDVKHEAHWHWFFTDVTAFTDQFKQPQMKRLHTHEFPNTLGHNTHCLGKYPVYRAKLNFDLSESVAQESKECSTHLAEARCQVDALRTYASSPARYSEVSGAHLTLETTVLGSTPHAASSDLGRVWQDLAARNLRLEAAVSWNSRLSSRPSPPKSR